MSLATNANAYTNNINSTEITISSWDGYPESGTRATDPTDGNPAYEPDVVGYVKNSWLVSKIADTSPAPTR